MASSVTAGPDRSWIPSHSRESDYFSYKAANPSPESDPVDTSIPAGFPRKIVSPTAWTAADIVSDLNKGHYTLVLGEAEIVEIEEACRKFKELNLPFEHISQELFPLPTLGAKLKVFATQLTRGIGFFHVRGLEPRKYSNEMNVIIYLGISSHIGGKRGRQDELGNMLRASLIGGDIAESDVLLLPFHLTDVGSEVAAVDERQAPYSNVGQPFHTDVGDILALYSLSEAECGGESQLASTAAIYNEIIRTRPDVIRLLASHSWIFDRFGQRPSFMVRPLLFPLSGENVLLSFSRRPLVGSPSSPRSHGIPDITSAQVEAINLVQFVAERHALSLKLQSGDLLYWNNLALLHSRTGFTDSPINRRHLLRLWLRNDETEKGWPIPKELQSSWNEAFEHAGRQQVWPLEPIRDHGYITNQQRSSGHA